MARVAPIKVTIRNVADFEVPKINWGALGDYFEISNLRIGIYKYIGNLAAGAAAACRRCQQ